MRSFIPFTQAVLAKEIRDCTDPVQVSGLKHALDIVNAVGTMVERMSADGFTDPRAIVAFQDTIYEALTRMPRAKHLRTAIPVEEWDRQCNEIFPAPRSAIGSSLAPDFEATTGRVSVGGIRGNN